MRSLIPSAVLAFGLLTAAEAAPHRLRVYPNPSITVYSIAEGPRLGLAPSFLLTYLH